MDRHLQFLSVVQESPAHTLRPISALDCIRVLHRLGFRIIHRARDLVLMERERMSAPQIARVPRTKPLPHDALAEILDSAGLCLPLFLAFLDGPMKVCGCCRYPYSASAWKALQRMGTMRDDAGRPLDLRTCAKCFSCMVIRPVDE